MPYITFTTYPDAPGRSYAGVVVNPADQSICAEVAAVLDGEQSIDPPTYAAIVAAAEQYERDHPPVAADPPAPQPTPFEQLVTALAAEPALSDDTKSAIMAISGGAEIALSAIPLAPSQP